MRCNGLPNAYDPGDLRNYMHMWQLEAHNASTTERNWLLNVNERTVLTQNLKAANATRVHLQQQQPVLGDSYAMRIRHVLGVCMRIFGKPLLPLFPWKFSQARRMNLRRMQLSRQILTEIDEALGQPADVKRNIVDDLRQLKVEYRQKLTEAIDEFTFKILSNIERDMK